METKKCYFQSRNQNKRVSFKFCNAGQLLMPWHWCPASAMPKSMTLILFFFTTMLRGSMSLCSTLFAWILAKCWMMHCLKKAVHNHQSLGISGRRLTAGYMSGLRMTPEVFHNLRVSKEQRNPPPETGHGKLVWPVLAGLWEAYTPPSHV
jgi:hypothetical protein